jgi:DNA-binding NarL/FixJ family response regulator
MSTQEIADLLRLSRGCVDKHIRRIYSKLGCSCRATLARLCIALDAIDPPGMAKVPAVRRSDT